jgi:hypothetical protein
MKYLQATSAMPLTLKADSTQLVKWWIDASFAVHPDMKSHTGGLMSLGKGGAYSISTWQKLVTKSSTEAELIGVSDIPLQVIWTPNFLLAQGYQVINSVVYQDNKSAIKLEVNGRESISKRTQHINIRHVFITDRIAGNAVMVKYCPTEDMVSEFFTKPLQGALFRKLHTIIMNNDSPDHDHGNHRSVLEGDATERDTLLGQATGKEPGPVLSSGKPNGNVARIAIYRLSMHGLLRDLPGTVEIVLSCLSSVK